jgi:hypothetical protein
MTQRTKLELPINQATELTLLYDEPISGKSQYGDYFMYAVAVGDEEYSYFAPAEVHAELNKLSKGDKAVITKIAAQRGNKVVTTYEVKPINAKVEIPVAQTANEQPEEPEQHDHFFDIMMDSYRDALEISKELNGMADSEKIAITLFIARSKQNNF